MDANQFRQALITLGLSQVKASKLLGVEPRTARRWAKGEWVIPELVAKTLRYMLKTGLKPERFEKLSQENEQ